MSKKTIKRILATLVIIILIVIGVPAYWSATTLQPGQAALAALKSDDQVLVTDRSGYITFEPVQVQPKTGLIFYPGGHVDFRVYAPVLRQIASQGYLVALVQVNFDLALLDTEAGAQVIPDFPAIENWATGGHSLGGVASAVFAESHPEIRAMIFLASYPTTDNLKKSGLKMLSISASEDGLDQGRAAEYRPFLADDAVILEIAGCNHSQFGDYGLQNGDRPATISPAEQWQQTSSTSVAFLQALDQ